MAKKKRQPVDTPVAYYQIDPWQRSMIKVYPDNSKLMYEPDGHVSGWDESRAQLIYSSTKRDLPVLVKPRRWGRRFLSCRCYRQVE